MLLGTYVRFFWHQTRFCTNFFPKRPFFQSNDQTIMSINNLCFIENWNESCFDYHQTPPWYVYGFNTASSIWTLYERSRHIEEDWTVSSYQVCVNRCKDYKLFYVDWNTCILNQKTSWATNKHVTRKYSDGQVKFCCTLKQQTHKAVQNEYKLIVNTFKRIKL